MQKVKDLMKATRTKAALATSALVASGSALAQTEPSGREEAIQGAIDSGMSAVELAAAGVVGVAAIVMGLYIILRLIGK